MSNTKTKSSLKSARFTVADHRREISGRHSMRMHGMGLGTLTLLITWLTSHALMMMGIDSMAVRYGIALLIGYFAYLGLLRVWAEQLAGVEKKSDSSGIVDALDLAAHGADFAIGSSNGASRMSDVPYHSGGGGNFGGGGASGGFDSADDMSGIGDAVGSVFEGAGSVVGESDDAAVVVVPIVVIFLLVFVFFLGLGSVVYLYFGTEALLSASVEIAFSYAASNAAVKIARQGWLGSVFKITWKPLLGALLCAIALGALIDNFLPQANSLFDAIRIVRSYFGYI